MAGGAQSRARARDLSRTGICLIGAEAILPGTTVQLSLVLAFANNAVSEALRLEARVVWSTAIAQSFQIGAMFHDVSEEQDRFLELFLRFLDGSLTPEGVEPGGDEDDANDDDSSVSPDDKDDPFKN